MSYRYNPNNLNLQDEHWYFDLSMSYNGSGSTTSGYNRSTVASYAMNYAEYSNYSYDTPNHLKTGDGNCTNFISACLEAGGLAYVNGNKTSDASWYYSSFLGSYDSSHTWGGAENFARHWGHNNRRTGRQRAYQTIVYANAKTALADWPRLYNLLKPGDIIQMANSSVVHHSMIICEKYAYPSDLKYVQHQPSKPPQFVKGDLLTNYINNENEMIIFHLISN